MRWSFPLTVVIGLGLFACSSATEGPPPPTPGEHAQTEVLERVFAAGELSHSFDLVDGYAQSAVMPVEGGATRGGFLVDLQEGVEQLNVALEVRGFHDDGSSTPWVPAQVTWQEGPYVVLRADLPEQVNATQIRLPHEHAQGIAQLTYSALIPAPEQKADDTSGLGTTQQALSSDLSGVIKSRSAWKARGSKCGGSDNNKYRFAIHHTYTPTSSSAGYEARLRSIQAYHMDTRNWCDVGYHFLVTDDGRVWEGRPLKFRGAHVANNNTGNIGISYVGCFHPGACSKISNTTIPTDAAVNGGGKALGVLAKKYGISLTSSKVLGHRDHKGASTSCPGDKLHSRLHDLISIAKGDTNPPPPPPPGDARVLGVVWNLAYEGGPGTSQRVTDATVGIEGGPTTKVRASDSFWSFKLTPGTYTIVASAPGFDSISKQVTLGEGDTWSSVGLNPTISNGFVNVKVSGDGKTLGSGIVVVPGVSAHRAGSGGLVQLELPPGQVNLEVFHEGYASKTITVNVQAGATTPVTASLTAQSKPPASGRIQGVVWDKSVTSSPSSSGNKRVDQAIVACSCGQALKARAGDAYWYFDAPPGNHTFTVYADGYGTAVKSADISSGSKAWGSVGVTPASN